MCSVASQLALRPAAPFTRDRVRDRKEVQKSVATLPAVREVTWSRGSTYATANMHDPLGEE